MLDVPGLGCLAIGSRSDYEFYYSTNEMLEALSIVIDSKINENLVAFPWETIFANESTDISNTKRITITARYVDPETSEPCNVFLRGCKYEKGTGS